MRFSHFPLPFDPCSRLVVAASLVFMVTFGGCGPRPVVGGTKGTLRGGNAPVSDLQITVHSAATGVWTPIGFAVSANDGSFELVTTGAKGSLFLTPGDYRCTLESAGAPLAIPPIYARPETTPLVVTWPTATEQLELSVPALKLIR